MAIRQYPLLVDEDEKVDFIRANLDLSDEKLAQLTHDTEFFVKVVREQTENKELQRGWDPRGK